MSHMVSQKRPSASLGGHEQRPSLGSFAEAVAKKVTDGNPLKAKLGIFIQEQGAISVGSLWKRATDHESLRTTVAEVDSRTKNEVRYCIVCLIK